MRGRATAVLALVAGLVLTGCSSGRQPAAAEHAAQRFADALGRADGEQACAWLAPQTRHEVERSEQKPCAQAVLAAQLPKVDRVLTTSRFGRQALVTMGGPEAQDTYFVARFTRGWRVVAAACRPGASGAPYDCDLQGS